MALQAGSTSAVVTPASEDHRSTPCMSESACITPPQEQESAVKSATGSAVTVIQTVSTAARVLHLFIRHIPQDITQDTIQKSLQAYGEVVASAVNDSKRFAFVDIVPLNKAVIAQIRSRSSWVRVGGRMCRVEERVNTRAFQRLVAATSSTDADTTTVAPTSSSIPDGVNGDSDEHIDLQLQQDSSEPDTNSEAGDDYGKDGQGTGNDNGDEMSCGNEADVGYGRHVTSDFLDASRTLTASAFSILKDDLIRHLEDMLEKKITTFHESQVSLEQERLLLEAEWKLRLESAEKTREAEKAMLLEKHRMALEVERMRVQELTILLAAKQQPTVSTSTILSSSSFERGAISQQISTQAPSERSCQQERLQVEREMNAVLKAASAVSEAVDSLKQIAISVNEAVAKLSEPYHKQQPFENVGAFGVGADKSLNADPQIVQSRYHMPLQQFDSSLGKESGGQSIVKDPAFALYDSTTLARMGIGASGSACGFSRSSFVAALAVEEDIFVQGILEDSLKVTDSNVQDVTLFANPLPKSSSAPPGFETNLNSSGSVTSYVSRSSSVDLVLASPNGSSSFDDNNSTGSYMHSLERSLPPIWMNNAYISSDIRSDVPRPPPLKISPTDAASQNFPPPTRISAPIMLPSHEGLGSGSGMQSISWREATIGVGGGSLSSQVPTPTRTTLPSAGVNHF